jgi:hypothetical protein
MSARNRLHLISARSSRENNPLSYCHHVVGDFGPVSVFVELGGPPRRKPLGLEFMMAIDLKKFERVAAKQTRSKKRTLYENE